MGIAFGMRYNYDTKNPTGQATSGRASRTLLQPGDRPWRSLLARFRFVPMTPANSPLPALRRPLMEVMTATPQQR